MLHLYDTAKGAIVPVEPRVEGQLSMYVCGPTVSGDFHIGHGRFTTVWDVIRRYASYRGLAVRFVSNITDVEDKIIARAIWEDRPAHAVAAAYEVRWWELMDALGVNRPDESPHATAYVEDMVRLIADLVDRGHAYLGGDGVYFASETIDGYGLLARQPLGSLRAGARVETGDEAGKRSPVDFVLWKLAKENEPSWPSPWGNGRPGWHTECVVMALDLLGEDFDLHGGGTDLAFPHHENERVQAIGIGRRFARHWVHSAMVVADGGEKMSKSLGNTMSLADVVSRWDPRAFRLLVLQSHYRNPMTVTESTLTSAAKALEGLDGFAREFAGARGAPIDPEAKAAFVAAMDGDLNTPEAVADLFALTRAARSASRPQAEALAAAVFELFDEALGLPLRFAVSEVPASAMAQAGERDRARKERDWATADRIRDDLVAEGYVVEDGSGGTTLRRRSPEGHAGS
ncbi:MAG: cysteine--tRNA ligase [Actinomycetota bacterium]|nr:cysteine--tRNA ligase [Actinomycetota bacterium]